jgi:hypothetical protein
MYRGSRLGPQLLVTLADDTGEVTELLSNVDGSVITGQLSSVRSVTLSADWMTLMSLTGLS